MKNKISTPYQLKYQKNLREKLKKQGLCSHCRHPIEDKKYVRCSKCRAKANKARLDKIKRLRKKGICICGKPIEVRKKDGMCKVCWFKRISLSGTGSRKNWLTIKNLLEKQNYQCSYSGKNLVVGKNASLDHIVPISKGGDNSIRNLQWIDLQINVMKRNIVHKKFLSIIKEIYSHNF